VQARNVARHREDWVKRNDTSAAGGLAMRNPDNGAMTLTSVSAPAVSEFQGPLNVRAWNASRSHEREVSST